MKKSTVLYKSGDRLGGILQALAAVRFSKKKTLAPPVDCAVQQSYY
jgi:hypothetical protein